VVFVTTNKKKQEIVTDLKNPLRGAKTPPMRKKKEVFAREALELKKGNRGMLALNTRCLTPV
jgi:hypothetical protein